MSCKKIRSKRRMGLGGTISPIATAFQTVVGIGQGIGIQQEMNEMKNKQDLHNRLNNFNLDPVYNRNIPLMPNGGMVGSDQVELEKGEVYRTPDGLMNNIPNTAPSHSQGGVPIELPDSTEVLGKKKIMGKEFKELGQQLEKAQTKYLNILDKNPTSIATNTAKRSLANIQTKFDSLFALQGEDAGMSQMPNGGVVNPPGQNAAQQVLSNYRDQAVETQEYGDFQKSDYGDIIKSIPLYDPNDHTKTIATEIYYKGVPGPHYAVSGDNEGARMERYDINGKTRFAGSEQPNKKFSNGGRTLQRQGQDELKTYGNVLGTIGYNYFNQSPTALGEFQRYANLPQDNVYGPKTDEAFNVLGNQYLGFDPIQPKQASVIGGFDPKAALNASYGNNINKSIITPNVTSSTSPANWPKEGLGQALNTAATLAPVAYNIGRGLQQPEQLTPSDYYNPYNDQIRRTMADREYNVRPELEANKLAEATYYRNLREGAPSQSQYLGGLQVGQIATQRADAAALARKQNIDNEYLAQQAQMDVNLGGAMAQTDLAIDDVNTRARANQRNLMGTGLSQLSQYAQTQEAMNNQIIRDAQRLNLLPDLVANYTFKDGKWYFKDSNIEASTQEILNYVKGKGQ